jgi:HSP20 family protein
MKDKLMPWRKRSMRHDPQWDENPFDVLYREVNDLFETYFYGGGRPGYRTVASAGFELSETEDEIRVKVELPGMDEKDIQVSLEERLLTIRGEHREQKETKKRDYHVAEMSSGSYSRSIPLPAQIDCEKAMAKFRRGVLTLTLPKTEQAKQERRRIPVNAG